MMFSKEKMGNQKRCESGYEEPVIGSSCMSCDQRKQAVKVHPHTTKHTQPRYHFTSAPSLSSLSFSGSINFVIVLVFTLFLHPSHAEIYKVPVYKINSKVNAAVLESQRTARHRTGASSVTSLLPSERNNLLGKPGEGYYIQMAIGTPPQMLNFLVDTGSSNMAVAAGPHPDIDVFFNTSGSTSYVDYGTAVSVPYTQGKWEGSLGHDLVTLTSMENVTVDANIAFISESDNFFINGSRWQGIMGLAYSEIARPDSSVETYFDTLVEQTGINNTFSLQLCGTIDRGKEMVVSMGGSLVIGGVDPTLYEGDMLYVPLYKEWYYEVVITDISVNGISADMDCKEYNFDKTIVDSGTTNLRLPNKVYSKVVFLIQQNTRGLF